MKNFLFIIVISLCSLTNLFAQEDDDTSSNLSFGMKAGYTSTILDVKANGLKASDDISGFYFGLFGDVLISEKFNFHPELIYSTYSQDGSDTSIIQIPLLADFKVTERIGFLFGPQFDFLLDEQDSQGFKRLGLGLALGAAYDITDDVIIDLRYSFGITDRLDGDLEGFENFEVETRFSYLFAGLGYRF